MDLTRAVAFRSFALNTVTLAAGGIPYGCTVDSCDYSQLEVVQFTEKLALADGLDVGGVWLGARHVVMTGTIYDVSRGAAFDRLATLDAALAPTAEYVATPSSFGFAPLTFYIKTASSVVQKTLSVRSNGLRVNWQRAMFGGNDADPLALPWSATFVAKNPAIT
jgi:hypothetical protein